MSNISPQHFGTLTQDLNNEEKSFPCTLVENDGNLKCRSSLDQMLPQFKLIYYVLLAVFLIFASLYIFPSTSTFPPLIKSTLLKRSSSPCKKGVGYNDAYLTKQLGICWAYNWAIEQDRSDLLGEGVEFVPMLWGEGSLSTWIQKAQTAIASGNTHFLGFNEPDIPSQSNISPSLAANYWVGYMLPLLQGSSPNTVKLISPAVTNGIQDGMGVNWLIDFVRDCEIEVGVENCGISAYALHWYAPCSATQEFKDYFTRAYQILQKPLWITEFMCTDSPVEQATFLQNVLPWLESQSFVERYAAFGDFYNNDLANFVDSNGVPNDLGRVYADA